MPPFINRCISAVDATGGYRPEEAGICFLLQEEMVNEKKIKSITEIFDILFIKQPILCTTVVMH
jgi:hypothetical protein